MPCVPFAADLHPNPLTFLVEGVIDFQHFAYHCQYACLNDTLKDYLHSVEVPCPKSLTTILNGLSGEDLNLFLQSSLWFFFRTLSREVGVSLVDFLFIS